ncbi:TCR/Tet family MFS transporter [Owenweeksia hongkongensis]|uniref:TCR/Tet family MFS transporter n=1 Tax=Owenweeksia hongkongensis TaxID=253245 RepID=UPI003A925712
MSARNKASLGFIFVTILVDVIGIGIIIPVLPSLIENLSGEGLSEASRIGGWLMFSYAAMQFLFAPVLGELSDRFGRRPIILIALLGLGIDYIFHAFAPTIAWLFVGRILAGITGASFTVATAYIADISTPEKKAQNFGLIGAAFGLGFIVGPVIGGIASKWGVQMPFFIAAGLSLLNFLYGLIILPESLTPENRRPFDWKSVIPFGSLLNLKRYPVVISFLIPFFFIYIAGHSVQSTWTFFTMFKFGWDETTVGYSLAVVGILVAIVQGGLIRVIVKKLGEMKTVLIGMSLWTLGLVLFSFAFKGWMMFAFLLPYCLGGIAGPTLQGIISNQVGPKEQGELQGALTSLISLTSIIGPLLMTWVFYQYTRDETDVTFAGAPFMLGAILMAISIVLVIKPLSKFVKGVKAEAKAKETETHAAEVLH